MRSASHRFPAETHQTTDHVPAETQALRLRAHVPVCMSTSALMEEGGDCHCQGSATAGFYERMVRGGRIVSVGMVEYIRIEKSAFFFTIMIGEN